METLKNLHTKFIEVPLFMTGLLDNKLLRFTAFTFGTGLLLWTFKPSPFFDKNGKPFSWKLLKGNEKKEMDEKSVYVNWFAFSLMVGGFFVLFV